MANSKYEYIREFEQPDRLPLGNWIVVRIDGRGFHRFSTKHKFEKPNDLRAIKLMNKAAEGVLRDVQDIVLGYGVSDEFSFVFHHSTQLYSRRASKLTSTVASTFTAHYITQWPAFFPHSPLAVPSTPGASSAEEENAASRLADPPQTIHPSSVTPDNTQLTATTTTHPSTTAQSTHATASDHQPSTSLDPEMVAVGPFPTFDARTICYPRLPHIRDYLSWRQADCHINNLYNTTFWALVQQGGMGNREAEEYLKGTVSAEKNEILWGRFGVNYNDMAAWERKGSLIYREPDARGRLDGGSGQGGRKGEGGEKDDGGGEVMSRTQLDRLRKARGKMRIVVVHEDIISDKFWEERPWLLVE